MHRDSEHHPSIRAPLERPQFRYLWIASLFTMTGMWMHDAAASWFMTSLSSSPIMVALVQTSVLLPMVFISLPAGALADILDRRRYLLFVQSWMMSVALVLGVLALSGVINAWTLLLFTFLTGAGMAMHFPAYSALIPDLVPRRELLAALSLHSVAVNASRAIGPALAGAIMGLTGPGGVFILNALTYTGMLGVMSKMPKGRKETTLPSERLLGAVRVGLRFTRQSTLLRHVLVQGASFGFGAIGVLALLPVVARQEMNGTAVTYGIMLSSYGVGAVISAFFITRLANRFSRDRILTGGTLLFAVVLTAIAHIRVLWLLVPFLFLGGSAWLITLSSLQVAAQMALPAWVRARGLSIHLVVVSAAMATGSVIWGTLARLFSVSVSLSVAAVVMLLLHLTFRRMSVETSGLDLSPMTALPDPAVAMPIDGERGPVRVTVEYRIKMKNWDRFLNLMPELRRMRRRNGSYSWSLFQDVTDPECFTETYLDESWFEHLRHNRRLTVTDEAIQARINGLHCGDTPPRVTHGVSQQLPRDA